MAQLTCCLVIKSCLILCHPMDCSHPGFSHPDKNLSLIQIRILEWIPFPSPVDLPNLGTEPANPSLLQETGEFFIPEPPWKPIGSFGKESACQAGASGNESLIPRQCYMLLDNLGARLPVFDPSPHSPTFFISQFLHLPKGVNNTISKIVIRIN